MPRQSLRSDITGFTADTGRESLENAHAAAMLGREHGGSVEENAADEGKDFDEEEVTYPKPWITAFLITGISLSVFLISLDRTIVTTVSNFPFLFP